MKGVPDLWQSSTSSLNIIITTHIHTPPHTHAADSDKSLRWALAALCRLEPISHILVWSTSLATAGDECIVTSFELPRLNLTFAQKGGKLGCVQKSGWFVSNRINEPASQDLAEGIRHCLFLENSSGDLQMIIPHAVCCRLRINDMPLNVEYSVSLVEGANPPTFSYPLHVSGEFVKHESVREGKRAPVLKYQYI